MLPRKGQEANGKVWFIKHFGATKAQHEQKIEDYELLTANSIQIVISSSVLEAANIPSRKPILCNQKALAFSSLNL